MGYMLHKEPAQDAIDLVKKEQEDMFDQIHALKKESITTDRVLEYEPVNEGEECFFHRPGDAGYDLYTLKTKWIWPWKVTKIPVNVKIALPTNTFGLITLRSCMYDKGVNILNGIIDEIYRDKPHIAAHRIGFLPMKIKAGSRIGQMVIIPYVEACMIKSQISANTERGAGKFGSTN
jgi:dUTP pyrophosphatase